MSTSTLSIKQLINDIDTSKQNKLNAGSNIQINNDIITSIIPVTITNSITTHETQITALIQQSTSNKTNIRTLDFEINDLEAANTLNINNITTNTNNVNTNSVDIHTHSNLLNLYGREITDLKTSGNLRNSKINTLVTNDLSQNTKITTLENNDILQNTKIEILEKNDNRTLLT